MSLLPLRPFRFGIHASALALALLPFSAFSLSGQVLPADSVRLHERAREAQREFENEHRRLLPTGADLRGDRCEEYVGRLCLTLNDGHLGWAPPREDPLLVSAREELLATLAEVGETLPGDRWVLGQRIRYLGDVGRWGDAEELARTCSAERDWWCHGLLGYVLHRAGRVVEALDEFSKAMEGMAPGRASRWEDPYPLLEYPASDWLRNPGPLSPESARSRFWILADPLFLTPGNERLSEHLARRFATALYEDTALTIGLPWGQAFEQLLLRYGFIAGWDRVPRGPGGRGSGGILEHYHPEARGLLPPFEALEDPAGLPEGVWIPVDDRPRTASAPVRAPLVAEGRAQTAVLRRDGNLLVLGAYGIPTDTVFQRRRAQTDSLSREGRVDSEVRAARARPLWEPDIASYSPDTLAGLFLVADTGGWAPYSTFGVGGIGVLQVAAPPGRYLLSLEQWDPRGRWGARVRHGIAEEAVPQDVPHLSDLLLLAPGPDLPTSLSEAVPRLRPSTELDGEAGLTVAWEVYGLGLRREALTFNLSLVEEEGSLVRRALKRIGLFKKTPALTLSWTEDGATRLGPLLRAVDVELPPLEAGRYVLRLEMEVPYRSKVMSNRRITVF